MMNKKPLTGKTFRLIAAYSRLPREGRTVLDQLLGYLAAIDKAAGQTRLVSPKIGVLEKPQAPQA
jgi:hypothetical protein